MGDKVTQSFTIFLFFVFISSSGSSVAVKTPRKLDYQENQITFYSSESTTELDTVPIVNPITTTTPIVNPTSPPPPTTITTLTPPATSTTPTTTPASSGGVWCIASPTASETALQVALDYACGYGGADCSAIQPAGSCYNPNTIRDHASYAFNYYYQKNPIPTSCVFGGTAQLTYTDPSTGNCHFTSTTTATTTTPSISSPVNPNPTPPTTPTISSPIGGGGSTVYGSASPTGLPSSAVSVSCSSVLYFIAAGLMGPLLAAIFL
ncbi:X8 domain-containing protein [Cephalotus follicularis]|uniref:X8 domain-containing protein n=1 Tax=Cephalotus follicularis TaxID=3775 RepID=A0A1Q3CHI9_CEPFO|nr:X8 domain-containing protein [Cephalotus follicularis]